MTNLSRRRFLMGASAIAAATVIKANMPTTALESLELEQPEWVPEQYLWADGRVLPRSIYPKLFAAVGNAFGDVGPTNFRIPDMRMAGDIKYVIATEDAISPAGSIVALFPPRYA